jgi:hypothetical protein
MANTQAEIDEAFLNFVHERGHLTALEAESLRSELRRRKAVQKTLTMHGLIIHKGHLTQQHGDTLLALFNEGMAQPTLIPEAPDIPVNSDDEDTGRVRKKNTDRYTERRQTRQIEDSLRPTEKRPTEGVEASATPTDKRPTDVVDRSDRPTDKREQAPARKAAGASIVIPTP